MVNLNLRQLKEVVDFWVPQLRLGNWEIQILLTTHADINAEANNTTNRQGQAIIRISRMNTRPDCNFSKNNMEQEIVHELLHLRLDMASRYCDDHGMDADAYDYALETPIEALSWALVEMRRSGQHKFSWERKK